MKRKFTRFSATFMLLVCMIQTMSSFANVSEFTFNPDETDGALNVYSELYCLVTNANQLEAGKHYIIASSGTDGVAYSMSNQGDNSRNSIEISISNKKIALDDDTYDVVLSGYENNWTFYDVYGPDMDYEEPGYLYASSSSSDYLQLQDDYDDNGKWSISIGEGGAATIVAQGTNSHNVMQFDANSKSFSCYESASQSPVYLYVKDNDNDCVIYSDSDISSDRTVSGSLNIFSGIVTVSNGGKLTVTGTITNANASNFIIEDGGQFVTTSSGVRATVRKNISAPAAKDVTGWHSISSPVNVTDLSSQTNLTSGTYDMFAYDEANHIWLNQKEGNGADGFVQILDGRGYIYRSDDSKTLQYTGVLNSSCSYDLTYTSAAGDLAGFNLIGNPYPHDIYKNDVYASSGENLPAINSSILSVGYYILDGNDTWQSKTGYDNPIKSGEGVLVKATAAGALTISNNNNPAAVYEPGKSGYDNIKFTVSNNQFEDVSYVMFNDGVGLDKISHRNPDAPMLYIPQDGVNYAIATMSDDTQMFGLNFSAKTMGKYTIRMNAKGNYGYLHLIDLLTGEDVDMLVEDSYSFVGSPNDKEARFVVKLNDFAGNNTAVDSDDFAYQSGNEIIVEGNGDLQMFDVMGRRITTVTVNGVQTVEKPSQTGVYILRLNGKAQKIVVR